MLQIHPMEYAFAFRIEPNGGANMPVPPTQESGQSPGESGPASSGLDHIAWGGLLTGEGARVRVRDKVVVLVRSSKAIFVRMSTFGRFSDHLYHCKWMRLDRKLGKIRPNPNARAYLVRYILYKHLGMIGSAAKVTPSDRGKVFDPIFRRPGLSPHHCRASCRSSLRTLRPGRLCSSRLTRPRTR